MSNHSGTTPPNAPEPSDPTPGSTGASNWGPGTPVPGAPRPSAPAPSAPAPSAAAPSAPAPIVPAPTVPRPGGPQPDAAANGGAGPSNLTTTLANIRELLTNVVGIITVVASALATFGVGAVVGHNVATPEPGPTITVTAPPGKVTAPPTTPGPEPTTASPLPTTTPPSSNGTVLGTYSVNFGFGHSIPLGPTKPTQSQFSTTGLGDLGTGAPAGHLVFLPINGDKMLSLAAGSVPSYEACASNTVFATQADSAPGTAFCLIENGTMAGVTVTSVQPAYVVLNVTVWSNTP